MLWCDSLARDCTNAVYLVKETVSKDSCIELDLLLFGGMWEYILKYLPCVIQSSYRSHHTVLYSNFCGLDHLQERVDSGVYGIDPVVLGIVVASRSEPLFHLLGFLVCLGSTAGRALKSVVQGILLTSEAEKLHSMNLLLYMAPISGLCLLPFTLMWEGNVLAITAEKSKDDPGILLLLLANMTVAYLVNLTNFLVTKHTSALTLQVLGNAKAAVAAVISVLIFQNP
ncbi:hypothetical protein GOP47_0030729 [Adiantum capillus-veneris]|nr:hypothetical protein GOP47_0030729 [Adiantum capillus-veneris]